ncbi:glycoside hydrolase family 76 protein [Thozetella sp. PMI_491]|nr:glycoside hydrolase family 76 protein [Thozetella sp. PMI_491]
MIALRPFTLSLVAGVASAALTVDLSSTDSIKQAAKQKAADLLSFYNGDQPGQIVGVLPGPPPLGPYYWWEGGAMWGALVDYYHYTGDDTYNSKVHDAMLFQAGADRNYMDPNWTASLGNDDQAFWGMSAMLAAETNFPNPKAEDPQWLALAQGVFNTQAAPSRRDDVCGGGLRWQIFPINKGYDYKNSIANGCFFNLGARLARYTKNDTYSQWAIKTWDWMSSVNLIDGDFNVNDGVHVDKCGLSTQRYSYTNAVMLQGAAFMYNYTNGDALWQSRTDGLLTSLLRNFFPNGVAFEPECESHSSCNTDQLSFKGYLHRWMAVTAQVAPFTRSRIVDALQTSTKGAAASCTGGTNGRMCGFSWEKGSDDGLEGAGQEMNVLSALSSLLVDGSAAPCTAETCGTSQGDASAGTSPDYLDALKPVTGADKAGAGILTLLALSFLLGTTVWIGTEIFEGSSSGPPKIYVA